MAPASLATSTPARHPRALFALLAIAACEWFGFHALRGQIAGELTAALGGQEAAFRALHLCALGSSLVPVVAGIAVDLGGARRMTLAGGFLVAAGLLAGALPHAAAIYTGMGLVVAGKGLLQVGLVVMVADLYGAGDRRGDAGFTLFTLGANVGGFVAPIAAGVLAWKVGIWAGFACGALVVLVGTIALARWQPARPPEEPHAVRVPLARAAAALALLILLGGVVHAVLGAIPRAMFSPTGDDLVVFGLVISPAVVLVVSAVATIGLAPLLAWCWLRLGDRGREPSSAAKLALGPLMTGGAAFLLVTARQEPGGPLATLAPDLLAVLADLLIVPVALSVMSRVAPPRLRGTAIGLWLVAPWLTFRAPWAVNAALAGASFEILRASLTGIAVAAGLVAYPLLFRLGAGRR